MRLRSLLFVPGDRPDRMHKALGCGADALILDLEDAVAPSRKVAARQAVAAFLAGTGRGGVALFVRVNPLDGPFCGQDIAALAAASPDGIVLPKAEGASSVRALAAMLPQPLPILPIATETAAAIFELGSYRAVAANLAGLTWGAEDLPAAIGAATARDSQGDYTPPFALARSLTLFGAHAAGVPAIETVYPSFRDLAGLATYAARGRRDGFTGMMAIHPDQVAVINAALSPSAAEIAYAEAVVAAFAANPQAGVLSLEGKMIDGPHLKQARRTLAMTAY